jgi:hypothetical protein
MMMRSRPSLDLFFISGLILFLELALIRWLPAHVLYLSFFTNTVLLASFVGMSIGCMIARKPGRELLRTPYWLAGTLMGGLIVNWFRKAVERYTTVGDATSPDVVFFGTEVSALLGGRFTIPVELVAGLFFFLAGACLVGPGQELGRAFNRIPSRTRAYALNLLGSLTGIGLLAGCSWLSLSPVVWFAIIAGGILFVLLQSPAEAAADTPGGPAASASLRPGLPQYACLAVTVLLAGVTSGIVNPGGDREIIWSPYYRVDYEDNHRLIVTNLISHQQMHSRNGDLVVEYEIPYLLHHAVRSQPIRRILIIGAGSGNDISRALAWAPEATIDAVEIDPVIHSIGARHHPDRPYDDPRVSVHLNDGRNFLRKAPAGEYDLVIFALIDSLVLHSGYSNLRLESYLFTRESFRDVARVLKPDGWAAIYNYFRQGWIAARIRDSLAAEFGTEPVVLTNPPRPGDRLGLDDEDFLGTGGFAAFIAGRFGALQSLTAAFAAHGNSYWVPREAVVSPSNPGRFGPEKPSDGNWTELRSVVIEPSSGLPAATDDWPFLYVRLPGIPSLTWRGIGLTLFLSAVLWYVFRPRRTPDIVTVNRPSVDDRGLLLRAFLLGAGFMLIETKAVVEMALLFGSTWIVNTVVFTAILVMALLGNLFAGWVRPQRLEGYYLGLFLALIAGLLVPMDAFLGLARVPQILASCLLVFAPLVFAGVIFPVSFARTPYPDRFFGANIAGALFGGLAENASLWLGFQNLLCVAIGLYGLSSLFGGYGFLTPGVETEV